MKEHSLEYDGSGNYEHHLPKCGSNATTLVLAFTLVLAVFRRSFAIAVALISLHGRRWCHGSLSGGLGECSHIHFIFIGATEFDFQSYSLQRG